MSRESDFVDGVEIYDSPIAMQVTELKERLLNPGDEVVARSFTIDTGPDVMERYIGYLNDAGMDVGKGGHEFGYRMPLPGKKDFKRDLIIFRR